MPQEGDRPQRACDLTREVLSAGLDGEASPAQRAAADAHVAGCPACRRWYQDAAAVTRLARTGAAVTGPDVTALVLPAAPGHRRGRFVTALRAVLAAIGIGQLVLAVAQVGMAADQGHPHGGLGAASVGHVSYESAAWSFGIAVGFLWVAIRRGRPAAVLPILTVFVAVVVFLNASDFAAGRIDGWHAATHATEVAGYLIVLLLSLPSMAVAPHPPPGGRSGGWPRWRRVRVPRPGDGVRPDPAG